MRGPRDFGHDGVAVTPSRTSFAECHPAARSAAVRCLVAAALTAATAGVALAQANQPPAAPPTAPAASTAPQAAPSSGVPALPPQPPPVGAQSAPPDEKHGFFADLGHWWDKSVDDLKAKMKDQQGKIDDFNKQSADATQQAMKNAADAMTHLQFSHVIEIQETCPVAGNGAADCAAAATNVCKGKGYNAGQPLDVRTAEKCTASLWVSGQPPATADCPVETTLLRAACQ
jgi:hypothetical protein